MMIQTQNSYSGNVKFGTKYRLLIPNATQQVPEAVTSYTKKNELVNFICDAFLRKDVMVNFPETEYASKINGNVGTVGDNITPLKDGFKAFIIFTKEHMQKHMELLRQGKNRESVEIQELMKDVPVENTFEVKDQADVAKVLQEKIFPELEIADKSINTHDSHTGKDISIPG